MKNRKDDWYLTMRYWSEQKSEQSELQLFCVLLVVNTATEEKKSKLPRRPLGIVDN
jgi:hypothetical protein